MLDVLSTRSHFADHLRPVWDALDPSVRGRWMDRPERHSEFILTASYEDYRHARRLGYTRQAYIEHGIGQSYVGVTHGSYAGAKGRDGTELFLVPNEHSAARWRAAYPDARVEVVGSPRLDSLPRRVPDGLTTVALSWHWDCRLAPETRSTFAEYQPVLRSLAERFHVIGHAHPRALDALTRQYRRLGIEVVPDFADVCRRADVFVADNTSALYEFASTGRPVVVLNGRNYRRDVSHGLRFWEAANVGINVWQPDDLSDAIRAALRDGPLVQAERETALRIVYGMRTNGAAAAATALSDWVAGGEEVAA